MVHNLIFNFDGLNGLRGKAYQFMDRFTTLTITEVETILG